MTKRIFLLNLKNPTYSSDIQLNVTVGMGKAFRDVRSHFNPSARKEESRALRAVELACREKPPLQLQMMVTSLVAFGRVWKL